VREKRIILKEELSNIIKKKTYSEIWVKLALFYKTLREFERKIQLKIKNKR